MDIYEKIKHALLDNKVLRLNQLGFKILGLSYTANVNNRKRFTAQVADLIGRGEVVALSGGRYELSKETRAKYEKNKKAYKTYYDRIQYQDHEKIYMYWYDPMIKNWTIIEVDEEWYQIDAAEYEPNRKSLEKSYPKFTFSNIKPE